MSPNIAIPRHPQNDLAPTTPAPPDAPGPVGLDADVAALLARGATSPRAAAPQEAIVQTVPRVSPVERARNAEPVVVEAKAKPETVASKVAHLPPESLNGHAMPTPLLSQQIQYILLAMIGVAAFWLRLRDALASSIIGTEDPYLHMDRTWSLVQGSPVNDYPPGFAILFAPLAILGPSVFYDIARFLPAILGTGGAVATFYLCRRYIHPTGALTSALIVALAPEIVKRTNLFTPTMLDLAVLPILFLAALEAVNGKRWALFTSGGMLLGLLATHPWFVALALPPLAIWATIAYGRSSRSAAPTAAVAAAGVVALVAVLAILPGFPAARLLSQNAAPRFAELVTNPASLAPLPVFVNFEVMLTWPVVALAGLGAVIAIRRRTPFDLLAFTWTAFLLPLTLVDWFGTGFIPYRSVAFLGVGCALLAGIAIGDLAARVRIEGTKSPLPLTAGILAVVLVATLPAALATPGWYRIYDDNDMAAFQELGAKDPQIVEAGTWQLRAGYRSLTAQPAEYNPGFFNDERVRGLTLEKYPNLVVVIDEQTAKDGTRTDFLSSWRLIGQWGDVQAFSRT